MRTGPGSTRMKAAARMDPAEPDWNQNGTSGAIVLTRRCYQAAAPHARGVHAAGERRVSVPLRHLRQAGAVGAHGGPGGGKRQLQGLDAAPGPQKVPLLPRGGTSEWNLWNQWNQWNKWNQRQPRTGPSAAALCGKRQPRISTASGQQRVSISMAAAESPSTASAQRQRNISAASAHISTAPASLTPQSVLHLSR